MINQPPIHLTPDQKAAVFAALGNVVMVGLDTRQVILTFETEAQAGAAFDAITPHTGGRSEIIDHGPQS